ncbi:unnamed protein product [Amoebophrya sp. A25]|nr:unnamed protein product [Amoebophrya sp. A25]|eukprot:GSA25T00004784001.1
MMRHVASKMRPLRSSRQGIHRTFSAASRSSRNCAPSGSAVVHRMNDNYYNNYKQDGYASADGGAIPFALGAAAASLAALGLFVPFAPPRNLKEIPNEAFVFIKPHAQTPEARRAVRDELRARGLKITQEGEISGKVIDEKNLVDNHYYAIASKATLLEPKDLNVPKEKFKEKFGLPWDDALKRGIVVNAKQACEKWGVDSETLNAEWAKSKNAGKLVKFGGGFYCGLVDSMPGKPPLYVMNGFFMSMRQNYVAPGASIYYFIVQWDAKKLSWEDFRGKVLGPTDPASAPSDSLRGTLHELMAQFELGCASGYRKQRCTRFCLSI